MRIMQLIENEQEATRLRLILERGIRSLSTPQVAQKACRREQQLAKELEQLEGAERPDTSHKPAA